MKIPTCIACDRPLLQKEKRETVLPSLHENQRHFEGVNNNFDEFMQSRSDGKLPTFNPEKNLVHGRMRSRGGTSTERGSKEVHPYILRAGFKIPRINSETE